MLCIRILVRESELLHQELFGFVFKPKSGLMVSPTKVEYKFVCRYDDKHAIFSSEKGVMYPDTAQMIYGFYIETHSFPILDDSILVCFNGKSFSGPKITRIQALEKIAFFNDSDRSTWASSGYIKQS